VDDFLESARKYFPYIEELKRRLYLSTVIFIVIFFAGIGFSASIVKFFISNFKIDGVIIATTSPFQFAGLSVDIGFFCAMVATLPMVIYHLFSFTSSALTKRERVWFFVSIPASLVLFLVGFTYGFGILYYSFGLFSRINSSLGIQNIWDIGQFLSQIFLTSSLLGIVFQYPLVLTALIRMGAIGTSFLRRKRRIAIFIVFVITALLPPTDGLSLVAMVLPLLVLYEMTIFINYNK
jgi:sec-independent protein translocase protein TatC